MSPRSTFLAALLAATALLALLQAAAGAPDPRPFNIFKEAKKLANTVVHKVGDVLSPVVSCLQGAGVGDAAIVWLQQCATTKYYGKTAMAGCAANNFAPSDVKNLGKSAIACFSS